MRMKIEGLRPGTTYSIQARAIAESGVSEWSPTAQYAVSDDSEPPAQPTALTASFDGTTFIASWSDTNPRQSSDFKDFQVTISSSPNPETAVFFTASPSVTFSIDQNRKLFGTAKTTISIAVRSRDTTGNLSSQVTASATNAAPPTPTGTATSKAVVGGYTVDLSGITNAPADYLYTVIKANGAIEAKTSASSASINTDDYEPRAITVFFVDQFGQESPSGLSAGTVVPYSSVLENVIAPTPLSVGGLLAARTFGISHKASSGTTRTVTIDTSGTYGGPAKFTQAATGTSGQTTFVVSNNTDIKLGQIITGTGIAAYTTVTAINGTAISLSKALTGALSGSTVTFWNFYDGSVGGMTQKDKVVISGVDDTFNSAAQTYDVTSVSATTVSYTATGSYSVTTTAVSNTDAYIAVANRGQRVAINASGIEGFDYTSSSSSTGRAFLFPVEGQSQIGGWNFSDTDIYGVSESSTFVGTGAVLIGIPSATLFFNANGKITKTSGAGTPEIGDVLFDGTNTARVVGQIDSDEWYTDGLVTGTITILPLASGMNSDTSSFVSGGTDLSDPSVSIGKNGICFGDDGQITRGADSVLTVAKKLLFQVNGFSGSKKMVLDSVEGLVIDDNAHVYDELRVGPASSIYSSDPSIIVTNEKITQSGFGNAVTIEAGAPGSEIKLSVDSNEDWKPINATGGAAPAFYNYGSGSWGNNGGEWQEVQYRKMPDGMVRLRGVAKPSVGAPTGQVFTLPAGYRPSATEIFSCIVSDSESARVDINSSGVVSVIGYEGSPSIPFLSLSQVSFYAGW